jgi:23S rRNA U2552 (ribose-2'-O)-methylase RlmE/FtsJ
MKIICDAAPNFMGDLDVDHICIAELNQMTMMIAENILKTGGTLIMKTL